MEDYELHAPKLREFWVIVTLKDKPLNPLFYIMVDLHESLCSDRIMEVLNSDVQFITISSTTIAINEIVSIQVKEKKR